MDSVAFRIFCVEDDEDTCELISVWLAQASDDYDFVSTKDGEKALGMLENERFDVIVLDSWLAGLNGVELCKAIRKMDRETPIVFFSGVADRTSVQEGLAAGADRYLTKPCSSEAFVAAVKELAENGRTSHASSFARTADK